MGVRVYSTLGDLERDMKIIATEFRPRVAGDVKDVARDGNRLGQANARRTAGSHGKHYHKAFSAERRGQLEWEWGPDAGMPQGGMSFENGSRNQPPHKDIAKAADVHDAGALERKVDQTIDGLFWP